MRLPDSELDLGAHTPRGGQRDIIDADVYEFAKRTLVAGREGSWESEALIQVMLFGKDLNLVEPERGQEISWRQAGPSKRVHAEARADLAEVFRRRVTDPARYTEIAETLAAVVSDYCDTTAGPDGLEGDRRSMAATRQPGPR